ncbi:MAG: TetR/AcrR family transcriptional regulator [Hyphomicrobiales bacterium]|nr:TetR/AcrR family transcriptional regulator [Hyphomicrobiales bacterium]
MGRPIEFDRTDVLERALQVFWRKGYSSTSMQDLVAATGINKASIYNSFGDKEAFFVFVLEHYFETRNRPRVRKLVETTPAREGIHCYFDSLVVFSVTEGRGLGCLITNTATELQPTSDRIEACIQRALNMMEGLFLDTIMRGREDGSITTDIPPVALARTLLGTVQAVRVLSRARRSEAMLRDIVNTNLSLLDHATAGGTAAQPVLA